MTADLNALDELLELEALVAFPTLEDLLTQPEHFGLTTATALQRAVCRIIGGNDLAELADHPDVIDALNHAEIPPGTTFLEVVLVAAIRTAKSMIAAATAVRATQTVDLSPLLEQGGEIARYSVLSLSTDNARDVHRHVVGALNRPALAQLRIDPRDVDMTEEDARWLELLKRTGAQLIGSEFLMHPSGRPVEIRVVAGTRAGGSVVSKWSAGCCLDEAPRMVGASEGVVNLEDVRRAVIGRLLPGAQLLMIGSPWRAEGPVFEMVQQEWGRPPSNRAVVVSNGPSMNPYWWTPERCAVIKKADPVAYQTDVLAQFADAPTQLYPQELMRRCIPRGVTAIPYEPGHDYEAGMDPATRTNAWTLVIATKTGPVKKLVRACEWRGSPNEPLKSREVLREAATILAEYNLDWVRTDQWAADPLRELAADLQGSDREYDGPKEIVLIEEPMDRLARVKAYGGMRTEMDDGRLMLLDVPMLLKDLKFVRRATTQAGPDIALVKTPDGRHADFGPATVRAVSRWLLEDTEPPPDKGTAEYLDWIDEQMAEQELSEIVNESNKPWWAQR